MVYGANQHSTGHLFHHNYSHNNRNNALGYGVDVQHAEVTIYANIFQDNRHDIGSGGYDSPDYSSYEAYCNTVLGYNIAHNFDVHGNGADSPDNPVAGKFIYIHHNDFQDDGSGRHDQTGNLESIRIRGIPEDNVTVQFNRFPHPAFANWARSDNVAFDQRNVTNDPQNIVWNNNTYNGATPADD